MTDYTDIAIVVANGQNTSVQVSDADREIRDGSVSGSDLAPGSVTRLALGADVAAAVDTVAQASFSAAGLRWGGIGDSVMHGVGSGGDYRKSFFPQAVYAVGGMIARSDSIEAGVSGERSDQILARLPALITTPVQGLVLEAGINDANSGVTPAVFAANMTAAVRTAKTRGIPVVVVNVPPQGSGRAAANHRLINAYNTWLMLYAPGLGVVVADVFTALANASGQLTASYDSGDGIHPNTLGHLVMFDAVARAMQVAAGKRGASMVTAPNPNNLIADPLNARATVTTGGWQELTGGTGTAPTYSFVNDSSGFLTAGRWLEMAFDGTASGGTRKFQGPSIASPTALNRIGVIAHVQVEVLAGDWVAAVNAGTASVMVQAVNQSDAVIAGSDALPIATPGMRHVPGSAVWDIGPVFRPFGVPGGTTAMRWQVAVTIPTGMSVKVRVGQIGMVDTTASGFGTDFVWSSNLVYQP